MPAFLTKKFLGHIFVKKFINHKSAETHSHEYIELAYVLEGNGVSVINGKSEPLRKGNFYVIDYNSNHSYISKNEDWELINCLISPQIIDSSFKEGMRFDDAIAAYFFRISGRHLDKPAADQLYFDETGEIRVLFEKMLKEYNEGKAGNIELVRYCIREVLIKIARILGSTNKVSNDIKIAIERINEKCNENISLGDIADEIHCSLPHLSAKFKKETGVTFTKYLQNVRMEKAASLLTATGMPIEQIAEQVGYKDIKTFYLIFKQMTGLTPKEYRKKSSPQFIKN